ncbi:hypothetical protein DOY81_011567 [Sarcophaga bullata]|nr:hypothetical protein DOY81_011567 [Sarcophaga bullata]
MTGHGYKEARRAGLKPFIFAKEDDNSLYIAVAPRNLTLIGLQEAPIYVDQSGHRAFPWKPFFQFGMAMISVPSCLRSL